MKANTIRTAAISSRPRRAGPGMRALACALIVLPAAILGAGAGAYPHRATPVDDCVRAAVSRMEIEVTRRIEGTVRMRGDADAKKVVYLDVVSGTERLPVRMRLYCSVNENGTVEHVLSIPRLTHAG